MGSFSQYMKIFLASLNFRCEIHIMCIVMCIAQYYVCKQTCVATNNTRELSHLFKPVSEVKSAEGRKQMDTLLF